MQYKIFIQDKLHGIIEALNAGDALKQVTEIIAKNQADIDPNIAQNIRVESIHE